MNIKNNSIILNALEKELTHYKDTITEILSIYTDFNDLDISILLNKGFTFKGDKKGITFIDELRTHFNKTNIDYDTCL